jgi:hypothetical protein
MKKLLFFIVVTLLITGCGGSNMEKDAKEVAELTWKLSEISKKIAAGDNSVLPKANELGIELTTLSEKLKKKYSKEEDNAKFAAFYLKAYNEMSGNPELITVENENSDDESAYNTESDKLTTETKEILKTHAFTKITDLTAIVAINFDESHFIFRVLAIDGTELSRANGTYQISPPIDNSIAKIILYREGPIQKSPLYADNEGIDTELFLHFNKELLLQKPTKESLSKVGGLDLMMEENMPEYILLGRDAFTSNRINTQAEKDSIANEQSKMEEKKRVLEEKLKGF